MMSLGPLPSEGSALPGGASALGLAKAGEVGRMVARATRNLMESMVEWYQVCLPGLLDGAQGW